MALPTNDMLPRWHPDANQCKRFTFKEKERRQRVTSIYLCYTLGIDAVLPDLPQGCKLFSSGNTTGYIHQRQRVVNNRDPKSVKVLARWAIVICQMPCPVLVMQLKKTESQN